VLAPFLNPDLRAAHSVWERIKSCSSIQSLLRVNRGASASPYLEALWNAF
jgi:hypothetical protein